MSAGAIVFPGDDVEVTSADSAARIGKGLRQDETGVHATRCGILVRAALRSL
jgi:hypothetical protein